MISPLITIGIPTYNRKDSVVQRAKELALWPIDDRIEIIIIDNNSPDNTYQELLKACEGSRIKLYKNSVNLGFHGNFVELFKKAEGEYLLWSSDEDEILLENIEALIEHLIGTKSQFVSTQYFLPQNSKTVLYRGRRKAKDMSPEDVWYQGHLPGLVFRVDNSHPFVENFRELEKLFPTIILYYPHTMLIIQLMLAGKGTWWDKPITKQVDFLEPLHPKHNDGTGYYNLNSRWKQWKEFMQYLDLLAQKELDSKQKDILKMMVLSQQQRLFRLISSSIGVENKEALQFFNTGAKKAFGYRTRLNRLIKTILRGL